MLSLDGLLPPSAYLAALSFFAALLVIAATLYIRADGRKVSRLIADAQAAEKREFDRLQAARKVRDGEHKTR